MPDYVASYDDITVQLAQAQADFVGVDLAYRKAGDARATASARVQHLQDMLTALAVLEEVQPTIQQRAQLAVDAAIAAAVALAPDTIVRP